MSEAELVRYPATVTGAAERLFDDHGHHLRWAPHWRLWIYATPDHPQGWSTDPDQRHARTCAQRALTAVRTEHPPPLDVAPLRHPRIITKILEAVRPALAISPTDLADPLDAFLLTHYTIAPGARPLPAGPLVAAFRLHLRATGRPDPGPRRVFRHLRTRFTVRHGADHRMMVYGLTPSDQPFHPSVMNSGGACG